LINFYNDINELAVKGFSFVNRPEIVQKLQGDHFDVVIIGGGITGAGIALDAASRGLKTALMEKNDFASGTSSKSTKLIHGGLRYLKQFHFKMVADVGRERRIVHKLAPYLVLPEKMLLPVLKNDSMGMFSISIGLKLYDLLAGVKGDDRRKMLRKQSTLLEEPLLPKERVKGSGLYAEYRTDDARLTIEIIKTAHNYGATCINYAEVKQFLYEDGTVSGVQCYDKFTNAQFSVRGRHILNAAGPWVDELRSVNNSKKGKQLFITMGVHLVVPAKKLPVHHSLYFEIQDGRMIFLIPRDQITYIGTTDTPYEGNKDELRVTQEDAEYLLKAVNSMFPDMDLEIKDVESSWAGLRPLIYEEGKSASEISRKDEIFVSSTGLVSMAGGKLTGYRIMAKKVVDRIARDIAHETKTRFIKCRTLRIPLSGNKLSGHGDVRAYTEQVSASLSEWKIPLKYASYLVHNYGQQTDIILDQLSKIVDNNPELRLIRSELEFCLEQEMVSKPLDFIERRTGRLYFWIDTVEQYYEEILKVFEERFKWSSGQLNKEKEVVQKALLISKNFV
jgi:glycerol-3-phosphate dehydrogenase